MKTYKVYFSIPAYLWVPVEAENQDEAIIAANAALDGQAEWDAPEIDWDANYEYAFMIETTPEEFERTYAADAPLNSA